MLIGEYEHSLDAKGRLIMPSKLRDDMGEKFVITKGLDGCLFGFSQSEWENFETKLNSVYINTVQFAFDFERANNWGGFINTGLYLVNYDTNSRIIKTNYSR